MIERIERKSGRRYNVRRRGPDGRVLNRTFKTKREAEHFEASMQVELARGDWVDPRAGKLLFADYVIRILPRWEQQLRPSSFARDLSYLETHILERFQNLALAEIQPAHIKDLVVAVSSRRSAATTQKAVQIVAKVMREAVEDGLIVRNPCQGLTLPRVERQDMRVLEVDELFALADTIDARYSHAVIVAGFTGLRAGELFGLRAKRVDLLHQRVHVAENVVEVRGRLHFGAPKSKAGERTVPLPRVVTERLEAQLLAVAAGPDDLVFPAPQGGAVRLSQWRQRFWYPAVRSSGLAGLRIHDLRHTAVSLWIAAGASPHEIAQRAGHRSVVTVLDRYGHLLPSKERETVDRLDEMAREAARGQRGRATSSGLIPQLQQYGCEMPGGLGKLRVGEVSAAPSSRSPEK